MKKIYLLLIAFSFCINQVTQAQTNVFNPNDPIVIYNSNNPPATPPWGTIAKWVTTPDITWWNTSSFKAYYYNGMAFRLKFPKTYFPGDTTRYPVLVFLHGLGEKGTVYDNELQLYHCAQQIGAADDNGQFNAFILFPQSTNGYWAPYQYQTINGIISYMVQSNMVDINRVYLSGLSAGGDGDWDYISKNPTVFAGAEIISSAYTSLKDSANTVLKYIPTWLSQGGLDASPAPYTSQQVVNAIQAVGGPITYTVYPNYGHNVWDVHYAEPDAFPYYLRQNKTNPVVFFGRSLFCPSDTGNINVMLGVSPGFNGYEWRKNGVVIPGASSNTLLVNSLGTYDVRIKRDTTWSYWSPSPAVIGIMPPTQTPNIQVAGLMSNVIPSPDGNNVTLQLPSGYTSYQWKMLGKDSVLGTQQTFVASTPGQYIAQVTQQYGCSSNPSAPFTVINANGPNPPDPASGVTAFAPSQTQIILRWSQNPNPVHNETGFEIYRGNSATGPYKLVHINPTDSVNYTDNGLSANTNYFYIIRAIDSTAASSSTTPVSCITQVDKIPPTAPGNLRVTGTTRGTVSLAWSPSTDNVSVSKYDVYVNGAKSYVTTDTTYTIFGLTTGQLYSFVVKAEDPTGNISNPSNQIVAAAIASGLTFKYYTFTGTWNNLPDFNSLTPVFTGTASNVNLNMTTQTTNFGVMWQGYIRIPVSGTYTFGTNSDDGSNMYVNMPYSATATPTVNNDGQHGATYKAGSPISLNAGSYPITITYFQQGGSYSMQVYWQSKALGLNNPALIPDSAFQDQFTMPGTPPAIPSNFIVTATSYNTINLSWSDTSTNLKGFEIYRGSNSSGPFNIIYTAKSGVNNYSDTTLQPQTGYYYEIRAINQYGSSGFNVSNMVTTNPLPQVPAAPSNLTANANSSSRVTITWTDNSLNETGFNIYRSDGSSANFSLLSSFPAATGSGSQLSFIDSGLYAHTSYYYKITAKNAGGESAASTIANATTVDNPPVIDPIGNLVMRYNTQLKVNIIATDPDGDSIRLSAANLPSFAVFTDNGNGNGLLTLNPAQANQGIYNNVTITALDNYGASSSKVFSITVNNNYPPVINAVTDISINEGATLTDTIRANDSDGDSLTWHIQGLPSFASYTMSGNNVMILTLHPSYADGGTYPLSVTVTDNYGYGDNKTFNIIVNKVNPSRMVYIHFNNGNNAGGYWNNTNKAPAFNEVFPNMKNDQGATTNIGLQILSYWEWTGAGYNNLGINTGNNSGIYPDSVLVSSWNTANWMSQNFKVYGLDTTQTYSFTFFGSQSTSATYNNPKVAIYTIKGTSVKLDANNNTQNTVTISRVKPDTSGSVYINFATDPNSATSNWAVLNAMVIQQNYDDGTVPASPKNLAVAAIYGVGAKLNWTNVAYNASGIQVFRAKQPGGPFTLITNNPVNASDTTYTDSTTAGSTTYYYAVNAINTHGMSGYSDTASVTTPNNPPKFVNSYSSGILIKADSVMTINLSATDDPGDTVSLNISGLPPFATFQNNGNGQGVITLAPHEGDVGRYQNIIVTATDSHGAVTTISLTVTVMDKYFSSVYINFNQDIPQGFPWNNTNGLYQTPNMINDAGIQSGINMTQLDPWSGIFDFGPVVGNNTGAFPDSVMLSSYFYSGTDARRIQLTGLNPNMRYNFVFYGGWQTPDTSDITNYTIGSQSVSLNTANNTQKTVQINNVSPDNTGTLVVYVQKSSGTPNAYINAMVIQGYANTGILLPPGKLHSTAQTYNSISLQWNDQSGQETGFEIWRSGSLTGTYIKVATVAANTTKYSDNGLNSNTRYFYKIRAISSSLQSDFSNIASATTLATQVYINFNQDTPAGAPWNNTNAIPQPNLQLFSNMLSDQGTLTGMNMTVINNFDGVNPWGVVTGNNSGIYPDNVMAQNYWIGVGEQGTLRIGGLDMNKKYNFIFFGSIKGNYPQVADFVINGTIVTLNEINNTTNTVQINGVSPDANGGINVSVKTDPFASTGYCVISSLIIQTYNNYDNNGAPILNYSSPRLASQSLMLSENSLHGLSNKEVKVYPNPFNKQFSVEIYNNKDVNSDMSMQLYDMSGKLIMNKHYGNLRSGKNTFTLNLEGETVPPGAYLLKVSSGNSILRTFHLIKQ